MNPKSNKSFWTLVIAVVVVLGGLIAIGAGLGMKTRIIRLFKPEYGYPPPVVRFTCQPIPNQTEVRTNTSILLTIKVRNGKDPINKLDSNTMDTATVVLTSADSSEPVQLKIKPLGERVMIIKPRTQLKSQTQYTVTVSGLKTRAGVKLPVFSERFTTGRTPDPDIHFQKLALDNAGEAGFTSVNVGPDHKLYAGCDEGVIYRYAILPDGRLGDPEKLTALQTAYHANRLITGFCFDPASTATNPIIWVSHGHYSFIDSPDFTGCLSRMSGPNLEKVEDVIIHLPRAYRDHMNNQPAFGPDGALYFPQGASNAYGAPDPIWDNRPEHLLTATVLRLDVTKVTPGHPLDALTVDAGGTYDPRAPGAPLTVYAVGIRNAFDLVWTSTGQLYTPVNGSSADANSPGGPGVPALFHIAEDEDDWLFHIVPPPDPQHPHYYGHPNPQWHHYVLNAGNMTGGQAQGEIPEYPLGTKPDPDWRPAAYDFGPHVSANGVIEYMSDTFGGKLKHDLIVCRYNAGSDLIVLQLNDQGGVASTQVGIPGFTNLNAPLGIAEDRTNGNIYVAEYGGQCLTLMRPTTQPTTAPVENELIPTAPHSDTPH